MKKSTKGALASAAAAVLLLGGGTTLAYWTASADVEGGSITAGELKLVSNPADDCSTTAWTYATGHASAGSTVNLWVPGDVVTKSCTFIVTATGDNLEAELTSPTTVPLTADSVTDGPTGTATVAVTYLLDGTPIADGATITEAAADRTLTAVFEVTLPFGDTTTVNTNQVQDWTAVFDKLTVTLDQVDPNP